MAQSAIAIKIVELHNLRKQRSQLSEKIGRLQDELLPSICEGVVHCDGHDIVVKLSDRTISLVETKIL